MENKYSLTFPQKNIWLVEEFFGKSSINTIVGILNITREFNYENCEKAINKMVELNDALRLRVVKEDGQELQYINSYNHFNVDYYDLTKPGAETRAELDNRLMLTSFEVQDNPLYYFAIVRLSENSGYIFVKLHHLISDAWTYGNVATSLAEYLEILSENGEEYETKPSYIEFMEAEKEYILSERFTKDREFWREYLSGLEEPVGLKENTDTTAINAKRYTVSLDTDLNETLKAYCKVNRLSSYVVFMNALAIYMHRVTGKNDFVVGTPVLNRSNAKEKKMMGMFVSTMPVRFKIDESVSFIDMCKNFARETMTLFRHQKFPYSVMLQDYKEAHNVKSNLYDVMLSYQNARAEYESQGKYSTEWLFSTKIQNELEIHIMDMDETGTLQVHLDYLTSVFEDEEIEYIAERLFAIIKDGIENNSTVEEIEIMSEAEKAYVLDEFNDTFMEYPENKTFIDLFEEQVHKTPNKTAVVFGNESLTYDILNNMANSVASFLKKNNVGTGDIVAILQNRNIHIFPTILGILKCGATYLPIDADFPKDRIQYMLENSICKLVIQDNITKDSIKLENSSVCIEEILKEEAEENINNSTVESVCYVLYTSGSTGNPKGVEVTNKNITNFLFAMDKALNIQEELNFLCITTISFDIFVLESLYPLAFGHKIVLASLIEQTDYTKLAALCKKENVQFIQTTPSRYTLMLENEEFSGCLKNVKYILAGGENVKNSLMSKLLDRSSAKIYNVYGPTETTVWATLNEVKGLKDNNIGRPIANTKAYVLDEKLRLLPIGVPGKLYIGGKLVTKGYLKNETLTNSKFVIRENERIYDTGDIVKLDFDGILKYIGRVDFQVKINGHRIELGEIEDKLLMTSNVASAAVTVEDGKIIAYLKGENIDVSNIVKELSNTLPKYMMPNKYIQVEDFAYTANNKIDKLKLKHIDGVELINTEKMLQYASTKEELEIEKIILSSLNKNEKLDINSTLQDYGMDSIEIIRLAMSLSNYYNKEVRFDEIFELTISEIVDLISSKEQIEKISEDIEGKTQIGLSDAQKNIFAAYMKDTNSLSYNMACEVVLSQETDIEKLKDAINTCLNRHKVFDLKLSIINSVPEWELKSHTNYIEDITTSEREYREKILPNFVKPFDLLNDSLIRFKLVTTECAKYMLFDAHHIIMDGISLNVIIQEIEDIYNGNKTDVSIDNRYITYLTRNKNSINTTNIDEENFEPTYIEKNNYSNEFEVQETGIQEVVLDKEELEKISNVTKKVTLNSVMLSVFKITLSKFTNSDNLSFGVITSGRVNANEQDVVGLFSNTQVYNTSVSWNQSVKACVKNTEKDIIKLMNRLTVKNSVPINIAYTYQNIGEHIINIAGETKINRLMNNVAKFDISLEIIPGKDSLRISMQYLKNKYTDEFVSEFLNSFVCGVKSLVEFYENDVKDISILSKEEEENILHILDNDTPDYEYGRIEHEFEKYISNEKIAVVHNEKSITYEELNNKANALANYLIEIGVKPGDVVAVRLDRNIEYIISILGILKCGAVYLPIDTEFPKERVLYMLKDSASMYVITDKAYELVFSNVSNVYLDWNIMNNYNKEFNVSDECSNAYVMYTSGTSGNPKGTINTHKGVIRLVKNNGYMNCTEKDNVALSGTISFDASIFEIWTALLNGCTLHILDKDVLLDPIKFEKYVITNNISIMLLTSTLFTKLAIIMPQIFKNVKYLLTGGDVFSIEAGNNILKNCSNVKLYNAYGPTESSVISTIYKYDKEMLEVPIGKSVKGIKAYVLDSVGKILPRFALGTLFVGGAGLGKGYINNSKLTNEKFVKSVYSESLLYNTGDMTRLDKDYNVIFKGRRDGQVKIRGYRIELEEIKNNLLVLPGILEACVMVKDKALYAFVVSESVIDVEDIKQKLKEVMPNYMIPNKIYRLEKLPITVNGKIDYKALEEILKRDKIERKMPENDVEQKLYDIWAKVLKHTNFGTEDNFFDIGGDSILATEVILECNNVNLNITYQELYNSPTIKELTNIQSIDLDKIYTVQNLDLEKYNMLIKTPNKDMLPKGKDVILTGATGFLGAHILKSLITNNENNIVYCVVRSLNNEKAEERLEKRLKFFFGESFYNKYSERIKVIDLDLACDIDMHQALKDVNVQNVGVAINSAAYVKHYDGLNKFIKLNVETTKKIAEYCLKENIKLYHVSTLSVSGNMLETGQIYQDIQETIYYDETQLYVNQKLYNGYIYSKFLAEIEILKLVELGLNATILRMGNLTGRATDGKFQPNVEENAFANRLKAFAHLGCIPENLEKMYLEFTPIDCTAEAITKIVEANAQNRVLHLFNSKHIYMEKLLPILKDIGIDIQIVKESAFKEALQKSMTNNEKEIDGIIIDLDKNQNIEYLSNVIVKSDITDEYLRKLNFEWPCINEDYIIKYFKYLIEIGFLEI